MMSALPGKSVAKWLGMGSLLLGGAVLSTLVFSLLGTISTAALAGMMLGAAGRWKWEALPASLVFAAVAFSLGQVASADLELRQRAGLAALGSGTFWGLYLLTFLLIGLEKRNQANPASQAPASPAPPESQPPRPHSANPARRQGLEAAVEEETAALEPTLLDLQGTWLGEVRDVDGLARRRKIEIEGGRFALSLINNGEPPRLVAQGSIRWENSNPETALGLPSVASEEKAG